MQRPMKVHLDVQVTTASVKIVVQLFIYNTEIGHVILHKNGFIYHNTVLSLFRQR